MNENNGAITARSPGLFDGSARARLIRMGVFDDDGRLDSNVMAVFAGIFAGLFFDDLCDYYDDDKELHAVYAAFCDLHERREAEKMYLLLSMQYDRIRKPLPDPVWRLAGESAVREFTALFMQRYERLMCGVGLIRAEVRTQ